MKIGCVVMAAGSASRFGQNKLLQEWRGKPLVEWALDALPVELLAKTVVVTAWEPVAELARRRGLDVAHNDSPDEGIRRTVRLGLEQMGDMDACLFCVADQPLLRRDSVARLAGGYTGGIRALAFGGKRGNPVIFPRGLFGELETLGQGETGAAVIARHMDLLELAEAGNARELMDVDTPDDLAGLELPKNLFLTGRRGAGKSTLIQTALDGAGVRAAGFQTLPYEIDGRAAGHCLHAIPQQAGENDMPVSVRTGEDSCAPVTETFETLGVTCLETAIAGRNALILMDELGVLEAGAPRFRAAAERCLDGEKPVLGVLKDKSEPWLERVKNRADVRVVDVEQAGREEALRVVREFLERRCGK